MKFNKRYVIACIALAIVHLMLSVLAVYGAEAQLDPIFIRAIHKVETSGKLGPIKGDNGKALGPFQIHFKYWKDSRVEGSYEQCADYKYAVRVMTAYMNRYGREHIASKNYEMLARLHNGGPNWSKHKKSRENTLAYWLKVKRQLDLLREWGYIPSLLVPYRDSGKMVVFVYGQPMTTYVLEGSIDGREWYIIDAINSANNGFSIFRIETKTNEMLRAYWVDSYEG